MCFHILRMDRSPEETRQGTDTSDSEDELPLAHIKDRLQAHTRRQAIDAEVTSGQCEMRYCKDEVWAACVNCETLLCYDHFMADEMQCEEHLEGILLEIDIASPKALPSLLEEFDSDIESLHNSDADPEFHPGTCEVWRCKNEAWATCEECEMTLCRSHSMETVRSCNDHGTIGKKDKRIKSQMDETLTAETTENMKVVSLKESDNHRGMASPHVTGERQRR